MTGYTHNLSNRMKKKNLFFLISTFFVLTLMVLYVRRNSESFKKILEISALDFGILFLLHAAMMLVNAFILESYVRKLGKTISFLDLLGVTALNTFFNNIVTRSGVFVKGYLLNKIHNFPFTYFIFSALSFTLIQILGASVLGIVSLLFIYLHSGYFYFLIFLSYALIASVCLAVMNLPYKRGSRKDRIWIMTKARQLLESWNQVNKDKRLLGKLIFYSFLGYFIVAARLKYCFDITHAGANYIQCLLFSSMTVLASIVSITPEALGIREFLVAATYKAMNGNTVEAVVATTMDRIISISSFFIVGCIFSVYFLLKFNNNSKKLESV